MGVRVNTSLRGFIVLSALASLQLGCGGGLRAVQPRPSINMPPQSPKLGLVLAPTVRDAQKAGSLSVAEVRKSLWNGYVNGFGDAAISDRYGATPGDYVVQIDKLDIEYNRLINVPYLSARYRAVLKSPDGDVVRTSNRNVNTRKIGDNLKRQLVELYEVVFEQIAEDFFGSGNLVAPEAPAATPKTQQQM